MNEKLQKLLASVGLGSRRQLEQMIAEGRVSVNGRIAQLGDRASGEDDIRLDGRKVHVTPEREKRRRVVIYYKPEGEICSRHDPEGRPTVFDHLPTISRDRWVMVGRLDINSSGLLLFTNDGELANRLMHPSNEIQREYAARVMGEVTLQQRQALLRGVELDDGFAKFESFAELGGEGFNKWYQVVVKEGRNREVRRLFESQGLKVSRLLRTRYGIIHLPRELRTGRWLELDQLAINQLAKSVNLSSRETVKFNESEKRRIDKMLDNPMKARYVDDSQRQRRSGTSTEHRVVSSSKSYQDYQDYRQSRHTSSEQASETPKRASSYKRDDYKSRQFDRQGEYSSARSSNSRNPRQYNEQRGEKRSFKSEQRNVDRHTGYERKSSSRHQTQSYKERKSSHQHDEYSSSRHRKPQGRLNFQQKRHTRDQ